MQFNGKDPNGLNLNSVNSISLFVSGSPIINASSESVSVVGNFTASAVQTNIIGTGGGSTLQIRGNTQISGSITASLFRGDGGGLFNISATALGDLDRLKSGSATAIISPNLGLQVNTNTNIAGNLNVTGKINTTELFATYISSSIIYASGSSKFGDAQNDKQEFTGSVGITGSLTFGTGSLQQDLTTQEVLVYNTVSGRIGIKTSAASS
jgi:hypothetical protein